MPIQRTVSLPAPSDAVARARRELAPRYGAQVWDGPDRRVLLVRVPRREPDPVNDVEEAVEFLSPADVKEITHCLLVGDEAVAQVYARPLQDLMRQREAFDHRTAAAWRERLPGHLSHTVFQAPDDPRRRWRLVVRLPLESVRDLDEEILDDLADGMGSELETQRFTQIAAVYLVASTDDVRLEADMFLQELRSKWQSEEDRRRKHLQAAQRAAEEQRRREQERRQVVREMEARIAKQERRGLERTRQPEMAAGLQREAQTRQEIEERAQGAPGAPRRLHEERRPAQQDRSEGQAMQRAGLGQSGRDHAANQWGASPPEPLAEASTDIRPRPTQAVGRAPTNTGPADSRGPSQAEGAAPEDSSAPTDTEAPARAAQGGDVRIPRIKPLQVPHRVRELRARVDQAITGKPDRPHATRTPDVRDALQASEPERPASPGPADRAAALEQGIEAAPGFSDTSATTEQRAEEAALSDPSRVHEQGTPASTDPSALPAAPVLPVLRGLQSRLAAAGFETIVSPPTPGHVIDLAAERPEGDVQRIVVRAVERLDPDVAKELLKTARELEVDLVLCVADFAEHEALRLLVATKVNVVGPEDTEQVEF